MIDKIKNVANQQIIDLEYLKNSKLPVLLYGAGPYAKSVKILLAENDIPIDCVVLDSDFCKPNMFFEDYPVQSIEDMMNKHPHVNIVFGFGEYYKKIEQIESYKQVSRWLFFDDLRVNMFDDKFIDKHEKELELLYSRLEDELSRKVLLAYFQSRLAGRADELCNLNVQGEAQYFPPFVHLSDNEVFVDCGAFDGDSVLAFSEQTGGKFHKIYAFEPDEANVNKMKHNIKSVEEIGGGGYRF
ncbi:hypothetical protein AGMMS4957_01490 [Bacteroidia bacterium]|nr:hypothetical protein AGMMS4957_01490 [Bacteroidia bacterium]